MESHNSRLCVGLDIDAQKIDPESPPPLAELKVFTRMVIDSTLDHVSAYKLNLAFYEAYGSEGFKWLEETMEMIGDKRLTIGDAKRCDI